MATESKEVAALRSYLDASGVAHVITCTYQHSQHTVSGNISRHVQQGTDGIGLALDAAPPGGGRNNSGLLDINRVLARVSHQLYELIYAGPGNQCFKAGKPHTYPADVMSGHHDHVHVSVDKGVFIRWAGIPSTGEASHMLNKPACRVLPTPSEQGYYIIAEDGGVFSYGDALDGNQFSIASQPHNAKIVDAALSKSGHGMWLLGADGGIFTKGDAAFHGSAA